MIYDTIIIGGGPAGLSAAMILGRCRRRVAVVDAGAPRNFASRGLHGFLSRDGVSPQELLRLGRNELISYSIEHRQIEAVGARCTGDGFTVSLADGEQLQSRTLLLATGVVDHLPDLPGMAELYGRGVFHCPYCDGWEVRDQPIAAYGRGKSGAGLAVSLKTWSADVVLCTDGRPFLHPPDLELLARNQVSVNRGKIERLEGVDGELARIVFSDGAVLERRALFFSTGQMQHSQLATELGCEFNEKGTVRTSLKQETRVDGLYVAGDACRDVQFAVVAAAEGAKAGVAINKRLQALERA